MMCKIGHKIPVARWFRGKFLKILHRHKLESMYFVSGREERILNLSGQLKAKLKSWWILYLSRQMASTLRMFHAFTGCDTVSFFHSKGKRSYWLTWNVFEDITQTFSELLSQPSVVEDSLPMIERYVVLLYDRTSQEFNVDTARKVMFAQKGRELARIPPTKDALAQHLKRAVFQSSLIWNKSIEKEMNVPSSGDLGWQKPSEDAVGWIPVWTKLPPAPDACSELVKCGCRKGCNKQCKCKKANFACTSLCRCAGQCS